MKQFLLKTFKILVIVGIVASIFIVAINMWMVQSTKKNIFTAEDMKERSDLAAVDAVIVLGAYVRGDGQPSLMLQERLDAGIELYQNGFAKKLLMSGDHGFVEYNEVRAMKDYAISKGVPSEDIFMDHAGFSTYETMYRAKAIFEVNNAIVVTQEYHLPRALHNAQAMGIEVEGVICDKRQYNGETYRWVREVAARGKDFFYGIVKPEPTYLGDVISIKGNGDVTND